MIIDCLLKQYFSLSEVFTSFNIFSYLPSFFAAFLRTATLFVSRSSHMPAVPVVAGVACLDSVQLHRPALVR
jgi:hypothetical protein